MLGVATKAKGLTMKVKLDCSPPDLTANMVLPIHILLKELRCEDVELDYDLLCKLYNQDISEQELQSKKLLLILGENIYFKHAKRFSLRSLKAPLSRQRGFVKKSIIALIESESPRDSRYAIVSNECEGKGVFSLPYFIQAYYLRTNRFESMLRTNRRRSEPERKFCCIVTSNKNAHDRIAFFRKLAKYKNVDCYGSTRYTNADNSVLPPRIAFEENPHFFQGYKFVICFENSFSNEYITEKIVHPMLADSVPIYRGAPNVGAYFNTKSFINYEDYDKSYDKMIEKIVELDSDDRKYEEFSRRPWMTEVNKSHIECKVAGLRKFLEGITTTQS